MANLIVNGAPHAAAAAGPWGELLETIDREAAVSGQIVAAVRFDGVDEPGFREPAILVRPLESDLIVEVDIEPPTMLLARVLDEGSSSLPALESSARELAQRFRGIDVSEASRGLVQLAESLLNLVALLAASAAAAGAPLETLTLNGERVGPTLVALDLALGPLLEAQVAGDWITVADILEYEIAPSIPPLSSVFEALREVAGAE
jgi:hypothetical protein